MIIRKTTEKDIPEIDNIYAEAKRFMRESGNPNQWQSLYPNGDSARADIEKGIGYVVSSTLGKRGKQIGCAKESAGHSVAEFVNKLAELLGKRFSFLGQTKVKVKDKCQGGLGNAPAVLIHHRLLTAQLYLCKG